MRMTELLTTTALQPQRTRRTDTARILTSGEIGKIIPLKMIPIFREDSVQNGRFRVSVEMMETAEMLANSVMIEAQAHFVPFLAFEQFNGIDSFNRSYMKEAEADGSTIEFFKKNKAEKWRIENNMQLPETTSKRFEMWEHIYQAEEEE